MIERKINDTAIDQIESIRAREAKRIAELLDRDAVDRKLNRRRELAQREIAAGRFVNLQDTVDTLPDEQLAAGDFVPVEVDNPEGTVREQRRTIRRVARVVALHQRAVIDDDGLFACLWYRKQWERSGLDPLISSTFEPKYGSGAPDYGHGAKTPAQAEARDEYRWAKTFVPDDVASLFEQVVLHDNTIADAARLGRCRYANAVAAFRRGVFALMEWTVPIMVREAELDALRKQHARGGK